MAIYARLENGTYAEVTGVYKTDGTEVTEIFQGDRLVYSAANEIYGTLPLYYSGRGFELIDYVIYGNALQDGTPSPDAPVDATGCGTDTASGYKLPLTVNGTEYPIYLGQVETTRRIKKLVLTGEERWIFDNNCFIFWFFENGFPSPKQEIIACSHYVGRTPTYRDYLDDGKCMITINQSQFAFRDSRFATVNDVKSYLASQYANGTPVTIWYVLAEPETAIVNEPLMKIGDYADTVSFAQSQVAIPTVNGENVLDMTSTVKPSEVYIKGKGIKPTGYGQLTDVNGVNILDKDGRPIYVHGQ